MIRQDIVPLNGQILILQNADIRLPVNQSYIRRSIPPASPFLQATSL